MTQKEVTKYINRVLSEWEKEHNMNPRSVNRGSCDMFAWEVINRCDYPLTEKNTKDLPNEYILEAEQGTKPEPWHVWVFDGEKHYDSETPEGVKNWQKLPIFQRTIF